MWELQRFAAGGVVRTIGTGVYHDELCKGVEVGVSRHVVLAAILERGACAPRSRPERDRRPVAAASALRRSGLGLGRARVGLAERAAGP